MKACQGKAICKRGAEGLQLLGLLPGSCALARDKGVGIAVKVADGDSNHRVRAAVTVALLAKLGVLNAQAVQALNAINLGSTLRLANWRNLTTGYARSLL